MLSKAQVCYIAMFALWGLSMSSAASSPFDSLETGDFRPDEVWAADEYKKPSKHDYHPGLAVSGAISPPSVASGAGVFSILVSVVNEGQDDVFVFMDIRDSSRIILSSESFFENILGSRIEMPENHYPLKMLKGSEASVAAVTAKNSFVTKIPLSSEKASVETAKIELVVTVRGFERSTGRHILHRERFEVIRD